jgi:hypothetical protein
MDAGYAGRLDRAGLAELRISEAVILGHPWGASVCGRFGDQTSRVGPCASSRVQILLSELETSLPLIGDILNFTFLPFSVEQFVGGDVEDLRATTCAE